MRALRGECNPLDAPPDLARLHTSPEKRRVNRSLTRVEPNGFPSCACRLYMQSQTIDVRTGTEVALVQRNNRALREASMNYIGVALILSRNLPLMPVQSSNQVSAAL
ncbi:hypothetical protein MRX96_035499 [Rhipicephalus microplus]